MQATRHLIPLSVLSGALLFAACGDGGGDGEEPTPDTTAPTTAISPGPSRARALPDTVFLVPDEMATVYYTVDGTEPTTDSPSAEIAAMVSGVQDGIPVQFFAVDSSGNAEAVQSATFTADAQGPGPVATLTAAVNVNEVALSWTNPAEDDFAGIIVVVTPGGGTVAGEPEAGVIYAANDTLPNGETVLFAGDATSFTDAAVAGMREYALWAHDDLGNYSIIATTQVAAPIPAQNGTLSIDLATEAVTITQPTGLLLGATASYDDANDRMQIVLTTQNESGRILYALKALVSNLNGGAVDNEPDTFRDAPTYPMRALGLRPGSERTLTIDLSDVDGATDPVTFDLEFINNPVVISNQVYDSSGARAQRDNSGVRLGNQRLTSAVVDSMRGLAFFTLRGKRTSGLFVADMTGSGSLVASMGASDEGVSSTSRVIRTGNDLLFLTTNGAHRHGGGGDNGGAGSAPASTVELVRASMVSLQETARHEIPAPADDVPVGSEVSVSEDGTVAAIAVARYGSQANELWFFDLVSEEFIDTDAVADGIQPVSLSANVGVVSNIAWNGNATVYVGYTNRPGQNGTSTLNGGDGSATPPIDVVDASSFALTSFATPVTTDRVVTLLVRNGLLYINTSKGLVIRNLSNDVDTPVTTPFGDLGPMNFTPDGLSYWVTGYTNDECGLARFDVATNTLQDLDDFAGNGTDTTANTVCGIPRGTVTSTAF